MLLSFEKRMVSPGTLVRDRRCENPITTRLRPHHYHTGLEYTKNTQLSYKTIIQDCPNTPQNTKKYTTMIQDYASPLSYRTAPQNTKKYRTALQNVKYTTIIQDYPVEYKKYRAALQNKTHHYDTGLPNRIQKYTTMIQDYRTSLLNAGLPYKI